MLGLEGEGSGGDMLAYGPPAQSTFIAQTAQRGYVNLLEVMRSLGHVNPLDLLIEEHDFDFIQEAPSILVNPLDHPIPDEGPQIR